MWIIIYELEVLILEVEDILHLRIDLHLRKLARLTCELKLHLLEVICINVSVTCSVDELSRLKTAHLRDHHCQQRVRSDIERNTEEHVRTALIQLA